MTADPMVAGATALEGSLARSALPDVLHEVARSRRTGILTIQGEHDIIAISFLKGDVVAADALNKTVEDGLQDVLLGQGLIGAEQFVALSAEHQAGGGRVMDLLVERGFLTREQLLEGLREQAYRLLRDVLRWREGDFKFYAGDEVFCEEGFRPMSVAEALVRAAREPDGGPLHGALPDLDVLYERVEGAQRAVVNALGLSVQERSALERLDGRRTAAEIQGELEFDEYDFVYLLHRLQRAELIRPRRAAPRHSAPAATAQPMTMPVVEARPEPAPTPLAGWADTPLPAWAWRGVLMAVALLVAVAFVTSPRSFLYPFPWQGAERVETIARQRDAMLHKIDQAARAFHLLEGRFPDSLDELVAAQLLARRDLVDPTGSPLSLASGGSSYVIQVLGPEGAAEILGQTEGVSGDILLDPAFLAEPARGTDPPLVLLDETGIGSEPAGPAEGTERE